MPKVSVIIPVYNTEEYLRECLDSVINQTLKDIEIICVNDGSTDNSLDILNEYEQKDNRIKVISKHNSGYGATMNIGLETAIGKYIGIVESDDFVEPDMFEILYNEAEENNLDIVRCNFYRYNSKDESNKKQYIKYLPRNKVLNPIENPKVFYQQPSIWVNLYNKEFLDKNNIRFLETPGASYQDTSFAFKVYACAEHYKMINNALLHYRVDNEASSSNSSGKLFCVCDEYAEITRFTKEKNLYDKYKYLIPRLQFGCYKWNYERLKYPYNYKFLKRFSKEFKEYYLKGLIDKKLFNHEQRQILRKIVFFPLVFKRKGKLI